MANLLIMVILLLLNHWHGNYIILSLLPISCLVFWEHTWYTGFFPLLITSEGRKIPHNHSPHDLAILAGEPQWSSVQQNRAWRHSTTDPKTAWFGGRRTEGNREGDTDTNCRQKKQRDSFLTWRWRSERSQWAEWFFFTLLSDWAMPQCLWVMSWAKPYCEKEWGRERGRQMKGRWDWKAFICNQLFGLLVDFFHMSMEFSMYSIPNIDSNIWGCYTYTTHTIPFSLVFWECCHNTVQILHMLHMDMSLYACHSCTTAFYNTYSHLTHYIHSVMEQ